MRRAFKAVLCGSGLAKSYAACILRTMGSSRGEAGGGHLQGVPEEAETLARAVAAFHQETGLPLLVVDVEGTVLAGAAACPPVEPGGCRIFRRRAVEESLRWGEPCATLCSCGRGIFAAPLMHNQRLIGGLVCDAVSLEADVQEAASWIGIASAALVKVAEEHNLTNAALLRLHRMESERERLKAQAIHVTKDRAPEDLREIYLREEPGLLAAIRRGERTAARAVINRILVAVYQIGMRRPELLKSLALELVVMMCRAAVEAGADPTHVLGLNYGSIAKLAEVREDEDMSAWLTAMLERLIDVIQENTKYPAKVLLKRALQYMEAHVGEDLGRDDVARAVGLSGSHFSRLMREQSGRTFSDLLCQFRVNRGAELLIRTRKPLSEIALECGCCDQSHFTRLFRKYNGCAPGDYRKQYTPRETGGSEASGK